MNKILVAACVMVLSFPVFAKKHLQLISSMKLKQQ